MGIANDAAFNQSNGSDPVQSVTAVDVFVDRLPWSGPQRPDGIADAADGDFDTPIEYFVADMASAELTTGRRTMYLRARDSGGVGPTWARDVDIVAAGTTARLLGSVRDANTGAPLAVPVYLQLGAFGTLALPSEDAAYAMRAPPGNYALVASAPGYAAATLQDLDLGAATTYVQDVDLLPICSLFADDASQGLTNFSAQSPWGIGSERYFSAPAAFTDSPAGNYAANADSLLTMTPLDLRDASHVRLKFQSLCDTEAGFDYGRVEVTSDGSIWTEVWRCSGNSNWTAADIDLSVLDNRASAGIRFRFTSDSIVQLDGWSIDDIVVEGAGPICGGRPEAVFADGFE